MHKPQGRKRDRFQGVPVLLETPVLARPWMGVCKCRHQQQGHSGTRVSVLRGPKKVLASEGSGRPCSHLQMASKWTCSATLHSYTCVCHAMTGMRGAILCPGDQMPQVPGRWVQSRCRTGSVGHGHRPEPREPGVRGASARKQTQTQCRCGCQGRRSRWGRPQ